MVISQHLQQIWEPCKKELPSTNKGSITSVQAIYVPADDLTDPAPATSFAHLDATTVLNQDQIAELGIYPAVDPLDSTSRILEPRVHLAIEHYQVARDVQRTLQTYKSLAGYYSHLEEWMNYLKKISLQLNQELEKFKGS